MSYPINREDHRQFTGRETTPVFTCDVDRTYLDTRFSTWHGLVRIPFEAARDKQPLPGMVRLLREIRRGPGPRSRNTPLYFVSASPGWMRRVIERRMLLDGIEYDGTTFKDWSRVLRHGGTRRFRDQVAFKLTALLAQRSVLPVGCREYLLGDDLEQDPLVFCLYADLLAGRIPPEEIPRVLAEHGVAPADARHLALRVSQVRDAAGGVLDGLSGGGPVLGLVRLERHADPVAFERFGPRLVPCRSAFQMAGVLYGAGEVSRRAVQRTAAALWRAGRPPETLARHLVDLHRRGLLRGQAFEALGESLAEAGLVPGRIAPGEGAAPPLDPAPAGPWCPPAADRIGRRRSAD